MHFNPRPPRGGRLAVALYARETMRFQSTSSARRTTPTADTYTRQDWISIHVLREEDDTAPQGVPGSHQGFQSTSSARRTTKKLKEKKPELTISIHVLREEDDVFYLQWMAKHNISIHVLREEDDSCGGAELAGRFQFQSTSSARRTTWRLWRLTASKRFQSTSSARRTTRRPKGRWAAILISIHVLREEDDGARPCRARRQTDFNPRPPRGGRLSYRR